jgi:hypothetical protein
MATSGTYTYAPNHAQVIQDALELVGGDVYGETDPNIVASASNSLNMFIKSLNANKTDVNVIVQDTLETVVGTADYTLDAETLGIDAAYITVNGNDFPLQPISKAQYYAKGMRASTGRPAEFYYSKQENKLYLYFAPDAIYTVTFGKIRQYQDMLDDEETFDFPPSAVLMLTLGLAHLLSIKRGCSLSEKEKLKAEYKEARREYMVANSGYTKGQISTSAMVV